MFAFMCAEEVLPNELRSIIPWFEVLNPDAASDGTMAETGMRRGFTTCQPRVPFDCSAPRLWSAKRFVPSFSASRTSVATRRLIFFITLPR